MEERRSREEQGRRVRRSSDTPALRQIIVPPGGLLWLLYSTLPWFDDKFELPDGNRLTRRRPALHNLPDDDVVPLLEQWSGGRALPNLHPNTKAVVDMDRFFFHPVRSEQHAIETSLQSHLLHPCS